MKGRLLFTGGVIFLALLLSRQAAAEGEFSFYGLRFGMTRVEVNEIMLLTADNGIMKPGHGMLSLGLVFDRTDLLLEIHAAYEKPEGELRVEGLRRALREKFVAPLRKEHPGISAAIDEYVNRASLTLVLASKGIREENIQFWHDEYLDDME
jgi:hypothetical protein